MTHLNSPAGTASNASPPPPIPFLAVPLLSLAAFGSGISLRVTDPMLPQLATEFGVSLGDASLVVTVFSVAYGLAQLLFGPLGDRYGKYLVVACAALACAVGAVLCALAPGFLPPLGARLLARPPSAPSLPL